MLPDKLGLIVLLNLLLLERTLEILIARPFISSNTTIFQSQSNFWPWLPVLPPDTTFTYTNVNGTANNHTTIDKTSKNNTSINGTGRNDTAIARTGMNDTTIARTGRTDTAIARTGRTDTTIARTGNKYTTAVSRVSTVTRPPPAIKVDLTASLPGQFWPFVPIEIPVETKLPTHNFWPFIPVYDVTATVQPPTVPKRPWPPSTNRYNYGEVLHKSILFFEAQRSGWLPESNHVTWRGHSATDDRGHNWEDLTGGWYDSGDYIKFGFPMAAATSMLLWGLIEYGNAYQSLGLLDDTMDCVRWPLDYFIKAHTDRFVFYGQVGDPYIDHGYWGRPEDMDMDRPAYRLSPESPGSDLVAETAAALAAGHVAFRDSDPRYAQTLLHHAQELFEFAETFRGSYSDTIENAVEFYGSDDDEDELAWAAAWLYRATNKRHYLDRAQHWFRLAPSCWAQSWADKTCGASVLLYKMTKDRQYKAVILNIFSQWLPEGDVHYTPKGLAFRSEWGTLRYTANMAFLSLVAADLGVESGSYRRWALRQIHYMLGDSGRSYVVGYGYNPPTRPHHASSSCPSPPKPCSWADYTKPQPNSHILFGALVGGPDSEDSFVDSRDDYIHNEVGCEYNGGFQSALTALKMLELQMT